MSHDLDHGFYQLTRVDSSYFLCFFIIDFSILISFNIMFIGD